MTNDTMRDFEFDRAVDHLESGEAARRSYEHDPSRLL